MLFLEPHVHRSMAFLPIVALATNRATWWICMLMVIHSNDWTVALGYKQRSLCALRSKSFFALWRWPIFRRSWILETFGTILRDLLIFLQIFCPILTSFSLYGCQTHKETNSHHYVVAIASKTLAHIFFLHQLIRLRLDRFLDSKRQHALPTFNSSTARSSNTQMDGSSHSVLSSASPRPLDTRFFFISSFVFVLATRLSTPL